MFSRKSVDSDERHESRLTRSERMLIGVILLLVICMTYVVITPSSSVGGLRNEQRLADVKAIANVVHTYIGEKTNPSPMIDSSNREICSMRATNCKGLVDLRSVMYRLRDSYTLPHDPVCPRLCSSNGIGYVISENDKGQVTVSAPLSEQNKLISATL
jgi:hypothetical protein